MPDAKMSSTSSTASDRVEEVVNPYQGTMPSPSPTPSAKASSTSSTEPCPWKDPCFVAPYPEQSVDSGVGAVSSPIPVFRGDSPCVSSSGRVLLRPSLSPFPHGCLPFLSAPTNSGAVPGSSPTNGPFAKGKEPTHDLFMKDDGFEAGATNLPWGKGKEPETSSTGESSVKENGSNTSIDDGPSIKAKERQDRLYERVMAECTETDLALAKATSEERVASAAALIAQNRFDGADFELSELKRWLDVHELTKEQLNKACDKASLFMTDLLRDCIINRDYHVEQEEKERLMIDVYLNRMNATPLLEEMKRLEMEHNAKAEAQRKVRSQYVDALTKKGFLDGAREGRFAYYFPDSLVKYMESLFGHREFLLYVPNHDSHSRGGDNDR